MTEDRQSYQNIDEIRQVVEAFEARTLPKEKWTHAAHLTVGLYYLFHHDKYAATCLLRAGIISYNASVGGVNDHQGGYHETMTLFWIWVLNTYRHKLAPNVSLMTAVNRLLASPTSDKGVPHLFYSKETLFSVQARAVWVAPDRHPLDEETIGS